MGRLTTRAPEVARSARRHLQAFGFDPMSTRLTGRRLHVDVRNEALAPGPIGELFHVVDYDGSRKVWYRPVNLDDPAILAQGGLRPTEGNPWSHQQVVYAVAMSVVERFERFFGRRFRGHDDPLMLVPHAFEGRNAFFDPTRNAVLFGYYGADDRDPGPNLPGQVMFTCLSVDIVAHEVTHALMHRVRPHFSVATNPDVFAWHEAFADLVALFHHFVFPEVVSVAVAGSRGDLAEGSGLFDLADEFGRSTGRGAALRSAITTPASPDQFRTATEPHARGAFFVAGVFDAYLQTYRKAIADLLRIATGGTGVLPPGNLHPDLVARVTAEAVKNADRFLGMVVRAFDFLPVVDVTFSDVIRSVVTADRALYPDDDAQLRATLVECLRRRGIYPEQITSLADEALAWPAPDTALRLPAGLDLSGWIAEATTSLDPHLPAHRRPRPAADKDRQLITEWAGKHASQLGLSRDAELTLSGLDVVYRQAADGQPLPQLVLQFEQRRREFEDDSVPEDLRVPMLAATTLVARVDGRVDRVVAKPLPSTATETATPGARRLAALRRQAEAAEQQDALAPWTSAPALSRLTFAHLHSVAQNGAGR